MTRPPRTKVLCSLLSSSLLLATIPTCTKEDPADPAPKTGAEPAATEDAKEPSSTAEVPAAPESQKVEAPQTGPAPSYPAALETLLDLVPADQETFMVIRDPARAISALGSVLGSQGDGLAQQLTLFGLTEKQSALAADALVGLSSVFEGTPVELDKGIVVLPEMGKGVVVYASTDADALPDALAKLTKDAPKAKCGAVAAVEGFVACASEGDKAPIDLKPGKGAADRRKVLVDGLVGLNLDRALIAGRLRTDAGEIVAMSIEPSGGQAVVNVAAPALDKVSGQIGPGPAQMLGMIDAGTGFVWARMSTEGLDQLKTSVPALAAGAVASLSGEMLVGTAGDPPGLLAALSVSEPSALRGAIELVAGQIGNIPPTLPDGTKVKVEVEELSVAGKPLKTIHGTLENNKALDSLAKVGLKPEAYLFVADRFAGVHIGGERETVKGLAAYAGAGPDQELVDLLPPAAAADLTAGKVSSMIHVPLDGVSTDEFRTQAKVVAKEVGQGSGPVSPEQIFEGLMRLLGPLSSITAWTRHEGKSVTIRLAVQPFGDATTEEGKAANEAVSAFLSGKSAQEVFGALASTHDASKRALSYEIRAGKKPMKAMSSTFMVLVLAGLIGWGMFMPQAAGPPAMPPSVPPKAVP